MGTRKLVAKNDLYNVDAAGNDWQLVDARKNRAGWHAGPWHCMEFVSEWVVATLLHGNEDGRRAAKTHHFVKQNVAKKPWLRKNLGRGKKNVSTYGF